MNVQKWSSYKKVPVVAAMVVQSKTSVLFCFSGFAVSLGASAVLVVLHLRSQAVMQELGSFLFLFVELWSIPKVLKAQQVSLAELEYNSQRGSSLYIVASVGPARMVLVIPCLLHHITVFFRALGLEEGPDLSFQSNCMIWKEDPVFPFK